MVIKSALPDPVVYLSGKPSRYFLNYQFTNKEIKETQKNQIVVVIIFFVCKTLFISLSFNNHSLTTHIILHLLGSEVFLSVTLTKTTAIFFMMCFHFFVHPLYFAIIHKLTWQAFRLEYLQKCCQGQVIFGLNYFSV